MSTTRRGFLKGAAALTLLGAGAESALLAGGPSAAVPAGTPGAVRWALFVDTNKCAGEGDCKLCVQACHGLHNVPDVGNPKEELKWVWKEPCEDVFPEVVNEHTAQPLRKRPALLLCNHCDNPACVRVCPTKATWRREDGLVMMDPHRCIGCRYCMVACPYGARSFNWRDPRPAIAKLNEEYPTRTRGVVEKCTLCDERIARGEPPACVAACKAKALVFGNLADPSSQISSLVSSNCLLRRKSHLGTRPQVYYKL